MTFISRLLRLGDRPEMQPEPEPNFVIVKDGKEIRAHVPLAEEVKAVQVDYVQSVLALVRANAQARKNLAAQTLINVHGKALR